MTYVHVSYGIYTLTFLQHNWQVNKALSYHIPRLMIFQKKCSCYSHREMLWFRHLAGAPALSLSFQNLAHRIQKSIPTIGKSSRIFLKLCYFFYFCFSSPLKYIYLTVAAKWSLWRKTHCGEFCATVSPLI